MEVIHTREPGPTRNLWSLVTNFPDTMSLNIHIEAHGTCLSPNGKKFRVTHKFNAYQTTTLETEKIMKSENRIRAYLAWVKKEEVLYNDPSRAEHRRQLGKWVEVQQHLGFEIEVYAR